RMLGEAVLGAVVVDFDITEAAGEGELLGGRDVLVTDHNDAASVERRLDLGEGSLIERHCQIETGDLCACDGAQRPHSHSTPGHGERSSFHCSNPECSAKCA